MEHVERAMSIIMALFEKLGSREGEVLPQNLLIQTLMKDSKYRKEDAGEAVEQLVKKGWVELTDRMGLLLTKAGSEQLPTDSRQHIERVKKNIISLIQARGMREGEVLALTSLQQILSNDTRLRMEDLILAMEQFIEKGLLEETDGDGFRITQVGYQQLS